MECLQYSLGDDDRFQDDPDINTADKAALGNDPDRIDEYVESKGQLLGSGNQTQSGQNNS